MKDDLRLMGIATRIFHGRPTDREDAEAIRQATTRFTDRIASLEAKLAEKDALLREYRATAFAAGKAARDREIVEWLLEDHGDWSAAARKFADAIKRGEV